MGSIKNRMKRIVIASLIILAGGLGYATLTRGHSWGDDFACYIMQAKSVTEGTPEIFTEENRFTVEHSSHRFGPVVCPWGTPILLSPLYLLFGMNLLALKSLNLICYIIFLSLMGVFLFRKLNLLGLALLISLFGFNPEMISSLNDILADIPFLLCSTVTIFLIGKVIISRRCFLSRAVDRILLGLLAAAAFFIKPNGILLVAVLACVEIAEFIRSKRNNPSGRDRSAEGRPHPPRLDLKFSAISLLPYVTFIGAFLIWEYFFPQSNTAYSVVLKPLPIRELPGRLLYYLTLPARFFAGGQYAFLLYYATLPFLAAGIIKSVRRDYQMLLYSLFMLMALSSISTKAGLRYFFPVLPFYLYFVLTGLQFNFKGAAARSVRAAQILMLALLILVSLCFLRASTYRAIDNIRNHREAGGPFRISGREMFSFIREEVPEDAVVVFFKPRLMRMLTGRRSIMIDQPDGLDRGTHLCICRAEFALEQLPETTVQPLVKSGILRRIFKNSTFFIYRIGEPAKGR